MALLLAAAFGVGLFVLAEARAASPLIRLAMFRDPVLSASLAMSALVSTVMMATLVVGPFYLSRALGLDAALVGLVLSVGPLVAALTGVPAGRIADRFGAQRMTVVGLIGMAAGSSMLSMMPATLGISGYIAPIVVITGRLCAVPDGQQHRRHDRYPPGPAGGHFRHAQPVAQSRAHHRCIRHGCGVRASHRRRSTSQQRIPRPLPPACGSRSPSRRHLIVVALAIVAAAHRHASRHRGLAPQAVS